MKEFQELIRVLRQKLPLAYPVEVRRIKLDCDGTCYREGKRFIIRIKHSLSEQLAIETLLHEWSHGLAWSHRMDVMNEDELLRCQHDSAWGVAYSEVYRVYEEHYLRLYKSNIIPKD